ncbi:MAG: type II toxin-antitoxin system RelE/ParE family toxin [Planctomycetia bacterium]|nr:type II toxin-antitoxin system RelE/ParE family toxin [Planctomycetia bacterium]
MKLRISLRRLARAEFLDAADWYERRRTGRGRDFMDAVRQVFAELVVQPDLYPEVHNDIREAPVPGFPDAVYYRVLSCQITAIAVFHTARDPANWQERS